jgi:alpha-ketoglutarate-dependent taurine dioxygenase
MSTFFEDLEISPYADLTPNSTRMLYDLQSHGVAVAYLQEPMTRAPLYELGARIGIPMPESPPMSELAYKGVVLKTDDIGFGEPLGMHVDLALLPPSERPRITMLGCKDALPAGSGSDTLLCAMAPVAAALTERDREVLAVSRQELANNGGVGSTAILSEYDGRDHLSYWSMGPYGVTWTLHHPEEISQLEADVAVANLEAGMQNPEYVRRIPWHPGLIVAWDNGRFLHSRTPREPGAEGLPREIYRVRLLGGLP